jgi:hypothetical protein
MKKEEAILQTEELFNALFKFDVNQEIRHKGDSKSHVADMGLLILSRQLLESADDEGNKIYERSYLCRMVRFSGSGDVGRFKESELLTIEEYDKESLEKEHKRNQMREDLRQTEKDIFSLFKVSRGDAIQLKKEGEVDKSATYRVNGFRRSKEEGSFITLRKVAGLEIGDEKKEIHQDKIGTDYYVVLDKSE